MNILNKILNKFKKTVDVKPVDDSLYIKYVEDKYKTTQEQVLIRFIDNMTRGYTEDHPLVITPANIRQFMNQYLHSNESIPDYDEAIEDYLKVMSEEYRVTE